MQKLSTKKFIHKCLMVVLAVTTILVVSLADVFASQSHKTLGLAVGASEKGNLDVADDLFSETPTGSSEFRVAFRESQKVLYKKAAWDRFFGAATFYRKNMNLFFEPEALSLEILALIKHCQFDVAAKLIQTEKSLVAYLQSKDEQENIKIFITREATEIGSLEKFNEKLETFKGQLDSFEELLMLQKQMPKAVVTEAVAQKAKAFTRDLEWNISGDARDKLLKGAVNNIKGLRVYVKNKCSSVPVAGNQ